MNIMSGVYSPQLFISGTYYGTGHYTSSERIHVNQFDPKDLSTQGYFCPFCGYRLRYRDETGYYCDCKNWQVEGMFVLASMKNSIDD